MYNGYKNYETWNVALHINSLVKWYEVARISADYKTFYTFITNWGVYETPDGVKLNSTKLDVHTLDDVLIETF